MTITRFRRGLLTLSVAALLLAMLLVALPGPADAGTPFSTIDNGTIQLGVHAEGHLNIPGTVPSSGSGTTDVGLRYLPTGAEATSPGCLCEGWGAELWDPSTETAVAEGYANEDSDGGAFFMEVDTSGGFPVTTSDSVVTSVLIPSVASPALRVTHNYSPHPATPYLYDVEVTITNLTGSTYVPRYRRVMDWDIEPTYFDEFVTIQGSAAATAVKFASDDGFATANPFEGEPLINFSGDAIDNGPSDHGALFDFEFDPLDPGASMSFHIFYGAAGNEVDALAALAAVGAEVYSFGQPNYSGGGVEEAPESSHTQGPDTGEPNTFIFAFSGVGGEPIGDGLHIASMVDAPDPTNGVFEITVEVENDTGDDFTGVSLGLTSQGAAPRNPNRTFDIAAGAEQTFVFRLDLSGTPASCDEGSTECVLSTATLSHDGAEVDSAMEETGINADPSSNAQIIEEDTTLVITGPDGTQAKFQIEGFQGLADLSFEEGDGNLFNLNAGFFPDSPETVGESIVTVTTPLDADENLALRSSRRIGRKSMQKDRDCSDLMIDEKGKPDHKKCDWTLEIQELDANGNPVGDFVEAPRCLKGQTIPDGAKGCKIKDYAKVNKKGIKVKFKLITIDPRGKGSI